MDEDRELADPTVRVGIPGQVLTAGDYLSVYVLEWTLHHLDLIDARLRTALPASEYNRFEYAGLPVDAHRLQTRQNIRRGCARVPVFVR